MLDGKVPPEDIRIMDEIFSIFKQLKKVIPLQNFDPNTLLAFIVNIVSFYFYAWF